MAPSPPLIVFLSIVSLSVSLSCSALFLTVLLTSCTRGQLRDPLRQQGLATTDPLLSFWGAAQELQKLPPETRETPQGVSAFLDGKGESARAFGGAEGKEMRSGMAEEKFAILRDRFADWLVRSSGRKWAVGGAPSSSNPLLQTRLQDMLRARMLNGGARGDELLRGDESAIEQGRGDFVPEVGRGRKTTDNNEEHNEEDSLRGNSKGQIEPTKPFHRKVCCGRGNAEDIHNDVRGTGSSAHFKENKNKMHDARTNLATPAPLKKPFVFKADLSSRAANSLIKEAAPVDEIKTLNPAAAEGEPPRLAGLKASAGRLEPDFEWETERYDLHVRQDVKEVRFTPVLPPGQVSGTERCESLGEQDESLK